VNFQLATATGGFLLNEGITLKSAKKDKNFFAGSMKVPRHNAERFIFAGSLIKYLYAFIGILMHNLLEVFR